jgi:hypothetical protein
MSPSTGGECGHCDCEDFEPEVESAEVVANLEEVVEKQKLKDGLAAVARATFRQTMAEAEARLYRQEALAKVKGETIVKKIFDGGGEDEDAGTG